MSAVILLVAFLSCPRDILRAKVTFTCSVCGRVAGADRWELKPPAWIEFRYPGHTSQISKDPTTNAQLLTPCTLHLYDVKGSSDLHLGGRVTFSNNGITEGKYGTVNGNKLAPDKLDTVLRQLISRRNRGIGP